MQLQCGDNYEFMKAVQMTQPWFESLSNTLFEKKAKKALLIHLPIHQCRIVRDRIGIEQMKVIHNFGIVPKSCSQ